MRNALKLILGFLIFVVPSFAQAPAAELSLGYARLLTGQAGSSGFDGGDATLSVNLTSWLGMVGEFGGYHSSIQGVKLLPPFPPLPSADSNIYTFGIGPRVSYRNNSPLTPYGQVLLGLEHQTIRLAGFSFSPTNRFATIIGWGADLRLERHVALRLINVDFVVTKSNTRPRIGAGIVFSFGRR